MPRFRRIAENTQSALEFVSETVRAESLALRQSMLDSMWQSFGRPAATLVIEKAPTASFGPVRLSPETLEKARNWLAEKDQNERRFDSLEPLAGVSVQGHPIQSASLIQD